MKTFVLKILAAAVLTIPLSAQALKFEVPFEFTVGKTAAPSGKYIINNVAGSPMVEMMGVDRGSRFFSRFVVTHGDGPNSVLQPTLVFNRYDDQYFLSQIWTRGSKSEMPVSRVERELRKRSATAAQLVVLAMR